MARNRASRRNLEPRLVQCYHCTRWLQVAAQAMTVSCPSCYKHLEVRDIVINQFHAVKFIATCGRVLIDKRGHLIADRLLAIEGIEVIGTCHANAVSGRNVILHPGSRWKGDCAAPFVVFSDNAVVSGGLFRFPDHTFGVRDESEPLRSTTGIGPEAHASLKLNTAHLA